MAKQEIRPQEGPQTEFLQCSAGIMEAMRKDQYSIYSLTDSRSGGARYVGKTTMRPSQRLAAHVRAAKVGRDKSPKGEWIKGLLAVGRRPEIEVIRTLNGGNWQLAERLEVERMRDAGHDLLNVTGGGNGSHKIESRFPDDEKVISRLGVWTDSRLAKSLGLTRKAVTYHRQKLGIPASFCRDKNKPPPPMGGHNRIDLADEHKRLLGNMPDYKLAELAGCSKKAIARNRRALGIQPYAKKTGNSGRFNGKGSHPRWGTKIKEDSPGNARRD